MKRIATLALLMAFAGPAVGAETEPDILNALRAAGGITTEVGLCEGFPVTDYLAAQLKFFDGLSRTRPDYWEAFDAGVKAATAMAIADPDAFCAEAIKTAHDA